MSNLKKYMHWWLPTVMVVGDVIEGAFRLGDGVVDPELEGADFGAVALPEKLPVLTCVSPPTRPPILSIEISIQY